MAVLKTCRRCGLELPAREFPVNRNTCRPCLGAAARVVHFRRLEQAPDLGPRDPHSSSHPRVAWQRALNHIAATHPHAHPPVSPDEAVRRGLLTPLEWCDFLEAVRVEVGAYNARPE